MSVTRCMQQLQSHIDFSRHLESLVGPNPTMEELRKKRLLVCNSLRNLTTNFPPNVVQQAFKLLTKKELPHLYMVTFTFDPKKGNPNVAAAKKYLNSRLTTKELSSREPILYMYAQETHKSGLPHFHLVLQSLKSIPKSVFRDWSRKFGKYDFSVSKTRDLTSAIIYITKETVPKVIKATQQGMDLLTLHAPRNTSEHPENNNVD